MYFRLLFAAASLVAQPALAREAPVPFKFVPQTLTKAEMPKIAALYRQNCAVCHGPSGEGAGNGLSLYGSKDPRESAVPMHFGRSQPPPQTLVMPAFGAEKMLTQVQIAKLAEYIKSFRPPWP
jgi:mono/diheme cytochrome c family protein